MDVDDSLLSKSIFTFVVDRSGSMGGQKMEITKESLKLFIQSLPEGSQFQIISFGSKFEAMRQLSTDSCIFDYNDENAKFAQ